jgi:hypothetical protein
MFELSQQFLEAIMAVFTDGLSRKRGDAAGLPRSFGLRHRNGTVIA